VLRGNYLLKIGELNNNNVARRIAANIAKASGAVENRLSFLVCRASQRESLKRGISYCAILIPSIEKGATYELGNRPLDDNLTLGDNLKSDIRTLCVLLDRVSLVWAGDGWWGRGLVLYEPHPRAEHHRRVCRPVTLAK
jgi:hypothetical protein